VRRRHFEISIDSPFTVLNCKATKANTDLPDYNDVLNGRATAAGVRRTACGCPDSGFVTLEQPPTESTLGNADMPAPPHAPSYTEPSSQAFRPIHLLRVPSYSPPAFDAEESPPQIEAQIEVNMPNRVSSSSLVEVFSSEPRAVMSPPPLYDVVVGTPSYDGLADYFSRLADNRFDTATSTIDDDDDSDNTEEDEDGSFRPRLVERHSGRVNVANPRTPGPMRAPSRSLDIQRPSFSLTLPNTLTPSRRGSEETSP